MCLGNGRVIDGQNAHAADVSVNSVVKSKVQKEREERKAQEYHVILSV